MPPDWTHELDDEASCLADDLKRRLDDFLLSPIA